MPPLLADEADGMGQEPVGGGAAPLRVARREMGADVPIGQGAEERVGQGVQDHVAVRMADEPRSCGNAHAAEPDVIAIAEGVHVEARAEAGHIGHRLRLSCAARPPRNPPDG